MEMSVYSVINGRTQGVIDGSCQRTGREDQIVIYNFSHSVHLPTSAIHQSAVGRLVHEPVKFAKEVDKSSPKLYQALANREALDVSFNWFRFNSVGSEELYYQMILKNAYLLEVSPWTPDWINPEMASMRLMETVKLAYQEVIWSFGATGEITTELSCVEVPL